MNPIEETLKLLGQCHDFIERLPGQERRLAQVAMLQSRLQQPCILAIVGKVKAGKSSFLNALMGSNLAKVGRMEATATVNKFCYGEPENPERPVKVVWENGMETYESQQFIDDLQGNDEATLQKAQGIKHLEFKIKNEWLKELTLVDTPGTDAGEGDAVTDASLKLRNKHQKQTLQYMEEADAVIHVVAADATANSRKLLDDFNDASQGASTLNTLGVLSKVDIDMEQIRTRIRQMEYVEDTLKKQLHAILPVSAELHLTLKENKDKLPLVRETLLKIPQKEFAFIMRQENIFLTDNEDVVKTLDGKPEDLPVSLEERKKLRGELSWSIFRTIGITLYNSKSTEEAIIELENIANMDKARSSIQELFFNRSKILKCYHVLSDLHRLVNSIRRNVMYELKMKESQLKLWKQFASNNIHLASVYQTHELLGFLEKKIEHVNKTDELNERFVKELLTPLEAMQYKLRKYDTDCQMLNKLQNLRDEYKPEEYEELCLLFGLHGERKVMDGFIPNQRQVYWGAKSGRQYDKQMRQIAEYAVEVYGEMI